MLREDQHNGKLQNISILLTTQDVPVDFCKLVSC
jgi:hypothetical protein